MTMLPLLAPVPLLAVLLPPVPLLAVLLPLLSRVR
jgi:hypothetical protein